MERGKQETIGQLRQELLSMQGFRPAVPGYTSSAPLGPLASAFPNGIFPAGAVHECLSHSMEAASATTGFLAALAGSLLQDNRACIWISTYRRVFPPALIHFGLLPHQVIFIDVQQEADALWVVEEALKSKGPGVVVAELRELGFTGSRRLQLAVEGSRITGFIHRLYPRSIGPNTCVSRWQITPYPSLPEEGLPGVGLPRWTVQLLKIRNGRPGSWQLEWAAEGFRAVTAPSGTATLPAIRKTVFA